jgi:hypothetical protein
MDDRFYKAFDEENLKRKPTRNDWIQYAVPGKFLFEIKMKVTKFFTI